MGPPENPTNFLQNQGTTPSKGRKRPRRQPRTRQCLLKGCGRVFRPQQPMTRYCGEVCREQARQWREWKARRRYRRSPNGKQQRQAQGRRYRARRKARQAPPTSTVSAARVIPTEFFFGRL